MERDFIYIYMTCKKLVNILNTFINREKWARVNVSWTSDGEEVSFATKKVYFFRPDLSIGLENDLMMLPNIPMIVSLKLYINKNIVCHNILRQQINVEFNLFFVSSRVHYVR